MPRPRLHLGADISWKSLYKALLDRGHNITRTPNDWMPLDASDVQQLLGATAQGRCLLTCNIRDFVRLAQIYPHHGGIVLLAQQSMNLSEILTAIDSMLAETDGEYWQGKVRWLADWRR